MFWHDLSYRKLLNQVKVMLLKNRAAGKALRMLVLAWLAAFDLPAYAIIDASSAANTNAPADGAPWANVGVINGAASGVYVGNGWVLTAAHVGAGSIELAGVIYTFDGNWQRLTNSDGTQTDLVVFHLSQFPPLPALVLTTATPTPLSVVDLVGYGHIAGSAQTSIFPYTGFYWSVGAFKSWGNSKVSSGGLVVLNAGLGNVTLITTEFTQPGSPGATSDEAQASAGDSGGGVFQHSASGWQLVGITDLIQTLPGQTNNTAVYGDRTLSADIATYGPQVAAWRASTSPPMTITRSGTNTMVCWPDIGVAYKLQATTSLSPTNWTTIAPSTSSTNGQVCAVLPASGQERFFRLQKP